METLSHQAIEDALRNLPGWGFSEHGLYKEYDFDTYADAVAAIVRVGFVAEAADHHPNLIMSWKRVSFACTTHDAGGVTAKDVALAMRIEQLFGH
jgi:4a-hydroxytetrahydrobiopterin dehydratase